VKATQNQEGIRKIMNIGNIRGTEKPAEQAQGFYIEKNALISEAVSRLTVKIHDYKKKHGKKSIVLTGCSTANGTTMLAINLSVALARSGSRTLFIDADMRTQVKHKSRMADWGLRDVICGFYKSEDIVKPTGISRLYFMPSGNHAEDPTLLLCSGEASEFIDRISAEYDFVIIDCPAVTVAPEASALFLNVDGIILVCALNRTTKKQLQSAKNLVEPYADKYYGLAVNSVDERQYRQLFQNQGYYSVKTRRAGKKSGGSPYD